jgi:UDP-glucose 4-epimerase
MTKRIFVAGAAGFIGQAVTNQLASWNHELFKYDITISPQHDLSLPVPTPWMRPQRFLDDFMPDVVINVAGLLGTSELFDDAEHAIRVNVIGANRLLEWCALNNRQYVGVTMPNVFPSIYTATHVASQALARAWQNGYDLKCSFVRAFNAYGSGQKWQDDAPQKIIPTFARRAWQNLPIPIWGDGTQTVDLVHVDDVARMFVEALRFTDGQVFDAGTGIPLSVNAVADMVIQMTGSRGGVHYLPMRKGEVATDIVAKGENWDLIDWRPELDWSKFEDVVKWYNF